MHVRPPHARLGLLCLMLLGGCKVGPDYHRPQTDLPGGFGDGSPSTRPSETLVPTPPPDRWWTALNDPQLTDLIEQVVAGNLDLRSARERLTVTRQALLIARAADLPDVGSHASYGRARGSDFGVPNDPRAYPGVQGDVYDVGFDASWEIDLFGGTERGIEAAQAASEAAIEARNGVVLSLIAETARTYIQLRDLQERLAITRQTAADQAHTVRLTRDRFEHGLTRYLDVLQADGQLQSTEAQIPTLEASVRATMHRLAVLAGLPPRALVDQLETAKPVPPVPPKVPVGLPSDLLRRRPDIRRAERELAVASARIGLATSDLFPRLSLGVHLGLQSQDIRDLFHLLGQTSAYYGVGPGLEWTVFDGGRRRARIEATNAEQRQAMAAFEQTVLTALNETEDALVRYEKQQDRLAKLQKSVEDTRQAVDLARSLYTRGVVDFLAVLQAQSAYYTAQDQAAAANAEVATLFVSLNKALGGGWDAVPPPTSQPTVRLVHY